MAKKRPFSISLINSLPDLSSDTPFEETREVMAKLGFKECFVTRAKSNEADGRYDRDSIHVLWWHEESGIIAKGNSYKGGFVDENGRPCHYRDGNSRYDPDIMRTNAVDLSWVVAFHPGESGDLGISASGGFHIDSDCSRLHIGHTGVIQSNGLKRTLLSIQNKGRPFPDGWKTKGCRPHPPFLYMDTPLYGGIYKKHNTEFTPSEKDFLRQKWASFLDALPSKLRDCVKQSAPDDIGLERVENNAGWSKMGQDSVQTLSILLRHRLDVFGGAPRVSSADKKVFIRFSDWLSGEKPFDDSLLSLKTSQGLGFIHAYASCCDKDILFQATNKLKSLPKEKLNGLLSGSDATGLPPVAALVERIIERAVGVDAYLDFMKHAVATLGKDFPLDGEKDVLDVVCTMRPYPTTEAREKLGCFFESLSQIGKPFCNEKTSLERIANSEYTSVYDWIGGVVARTQADRLMKRVSLPMSSSPKRKTAGV